MEVQHLAHAGDVVGQRGQRELGCGDVVAVGLQALDDAAPAGAVGPCAVDENDVRSSIHLGGPFVVVSSCAILRREAAAGYPQRYCTFADSCCAADVAIPPVLDPPARPNLGTLT